MIDEKEYYEGYKESVVEELWDHLGRKPTDSEVDAICNDDNFKNYMQDLAEAYHEHLYC